MVSQAEVIKNLIETNWNLTGELSKTGTTAMKEVVYFFDREQVYGNEKTKAIEVVKINGTLEESVTQHPNFTEYNDNYKITCRYRVTDVEEATYSTALTNVENMAKEVQDILNAQFSPQTGVDGWFVSRITAYKDDWIESDQHEMKRSMEIYLTQIKGSVDTVFRGNDGVMILDTSDTQADNKPAGDYTYTELREVTINEGYRQLPYLTKDKTRGRGVPHLLRGIFSGVFVANMFGKKADLDGATIDKIENIYKPQASTPLIGQQAEIVFFHDLRDTESTPATFRTKSFMRIDRVEKMTDDESLLAYRLYGVLTQPSEFSLI